MEDVKKIFSYAKEFKHKTYTATVLATLSSIIGVIPFILSYFIIIEFTAETLPNESFILRMSLLILLSLFVKSALFFKAMVFSHEAAFDTLMGMRRKLADKLLKMPMGQVNSRTSGEYKNLFLDLISDMELILAHMIPEGIANTIVPVLGIIFLLILDWRLALLSMLGIFIGLLLYYLMMKANVGKIQKYFKSVQSLNSNIVEYIMGMEVIKVFNQTTASFEKYSKSARDYKEFTLNWYKISWKYMAGYYTFVSATLIFVLPFGAMFYLAGTLSLRAYLLSMLLAIGLGTPIVRLIDFVGTIPVVFQKSKIIEEVFDAVELTDSGSDLHIPNNDISFENVVFAYNEVDVIKEVSFSARANTITAIVGPSGSGKSTLAKLIVRFWDVRKGQIKVGGIDIREISFANLMNSISYVSQDIYLFNTSIMENIRMGNPNATDEEIIAVAKITQCHDFIMETEQGYKTSTGDAGNKLSGGQKQRISIARALLKNAPIIILDEATAFTDPENEDKIQAAINSLIGGKTLIIIAHRLSTIVKANNIIVMDEGRVSASGTHAELLKQSELYQEMWQAHTEVADWSIKAKGEAKAIV